MTDDVVILSYNDAAKKLGIKADSVRRRARNRGWKRIKGNEGLTLVAIPLEVIPTDVPQDIPADNPGDSPPDRGDMQLIIENAELKTELRMLKETHSQLIADRDAWRDQAQRNRGWWPFSRR